IDEETLPESQAPEANIRRSTRIRNRPPWMEDFVAHTVEPQIPFSFMSNPPAYNRDYINFAAHVSETKEPKSYKDAKENSQWVQAMEAELAALERNNVWELTPLPAGKKAIESKWVYKIKHNADGTVNQYKARLVAKGYNQEFGVDYHDSFSPVAKMVTVRTFL